MYTVIYSHLSLIKTSHCCNVHIKCITLRSSDYPPSLVTSSSSSSNRIQIHNDYSLKLITEVCISFSSLISPPQRFIFFNHVCCGALTSRCIIVICLRFLLKSQRVENHPSNHGAFHFVLLSFVLFLFSVSVSQYNHSCSHYLFILTSDQSYSFTETSIQVFSLINLLLR